MLTQMRGRGRRRINSPFIPLRDDKEFEEYKEFKELKELLKRHLVLATPTSTSAPA